MLLGKLEGRKLMRKKIRKEEAFNAKFRYKYNEIKSRRFDCFIMRYVPFMPAAD